jgi:hypothetical protein
MTSGQYNEGVCHVLYTEPVDNGTDCISHTHTSEPDSVLVDFMYKTHPTIHASKYRSSTLFLLYDRDDFCDTGCDLVAG